MTTPTRASLLPFLVAAVVLVAGWRATWFLCDDAFIAFRYVGNAYDGHGLVWNTAPFAPVEGYSCFLWVVVLWGVWAVLGVEPPGSANWVALLCGLATLLLVARRLAVVPLPERAERWRTMLSTIVLLGIASNPTFVTWTSSGLETAMFGLWAVGWTLGVTANRGPWRARDMSVVCLCAALAALTRPDGTLLVVATVAFAGYGIVTRRLQSWWSLAPLLLPVLHHVWRRAYYGEWLPNTYYAKVVSAWPESGLRYLYCFAFEHGLWLLLPLVVWWAIVMLRRPGALRAVCHERLPVAFAAATWGAFVGYYSLVVGGDHFAFRPFTHLVPLLFVATLAMAAAVGWQPGRLVGGLVLFAVAANGFGWWHDLALRGREMDGFVRASTAAPAPFGSLFADWDRHRAWLRLRLVALPRGLHAEVCNGQLRLLPERRTGLVAGLPAGRRGVNRAVAAGVVAWALADIAIVDAVGLNDWVVARTPTLPQPVFDPVTLQPVFTAFDRNHDQRLDAAEIAAAAAVARFNETGVPMSGAAWAELLLAICDHDGDEGLDQSEFTAVLGELGNQRHMAHERSPPPGYIESLRPNVVFDGTRFVARPDVVPLTDEEVRSVEAKFRDLIRR